MIVALAGGVGAARFLDGLARITALERLFLIGNTGDDAEIHGLHISPDLDTVLYTLARRNEPRRGWGLRGDSFRCLEALGRLGGETWFQLGDRDLATHLFRTARLRAGAALSEVTRELSAALGVPANIVPMSDDPVRTLIRTRRATLDFQTWFVKRRTRDAVAGVCLDGAEQARPAPGVLDAIARAEAVIVCPSNPVISIGPILAVPGIREALRHTAAPVLAISPIVGGRALKGPAARMLKSMGLRATASQVAEMYRDFLDVLVLDSVDARQAPQVEALGIRPLVTATVMSTAARKRALAAAVLKALEVAA